MEVVVQSGNALPGMAAQLVRGALALTRGLRRFSLSLLVPALALGFGAPTFAAPQYTFVDLTPPGWEMGGALAAGGGRQVGFGTQQSGQFGHALLWSGSAQSFVDLNPVGFRGSYAYGTDGIQQVGRGLPGAAGADEALLWNGTAASAIDLHPTGWGHSVATGVASGIQVGYASPQQPFPSDHAVLWRGTAESVVDLHPAG